MASYRNSLPPQCRLCRCVGHTATVCRTIVGNTIQYGNAQLGGFRGGHELPIPIIPEDVPKHIRENILTNAYKMNVADHICMWVGVQFVNEDKTPIPGKTPYVWGDSYVYPHYYLHQDGLTAEAASNTIMIQASRMDNLIWQVANLHGYFAENGIEMNVVSEYHDLKKEGDIYVSNPEIFRKLIADIDTEIELINDELDTLATKVNDCKFEQPKTIAIVDADTSQRFTPLPYGVIQTLEDIREVDEIQFGDFPPVKIGKFNISKTSATIA